MSERPIQTSIVLLSGDGYTPVLFHYVCQIMLARRFERFTNVHYYKPASFHCLVSDTSRILFQCLVTDTKLVLSHGCSDRNKPALFVFLGVIGTSFWLVVRVKKEL